MIMGDEVCSTMLNFLNVGSFNGKINFTYILLISKVKILVKATDFRLINLYNVIYKLVLKVLANRLKKIMHAIISPNRSVFILERLIIVNVIVAYEILHSMKTRHKGK